MTIAELYAAFWALVRMLTELLAVPFLMLPPPVLFGGGLLVFLAGGGIFVSGLSVKNRRAAKFRVNLGLCVLLFGLMMILFQSHPGIAMALVFLIAAIVLWSFFGFLAAFLFALFS